MELIADTPQMGKNLRLDRPGTSDKVEYYVLQYAQDLNRSVPHGVPALRGELGISPYQNAEDIYN